MAVVLTLGSVVAFAPPAGAIPSWTIAASPNPKGSTNTRLSGVSCLSATFCVAVGNAANRTLVEQWDGSHWSLVASPNRPPLGDSLAGVSCPSVTSCFAVGAEVATPLVGFGPLVEHWNGAHWSIMAGAGLGLSHSALNGVSCPSTNNCIAVGNANGALIESWNGSGWSLMPSADPGSSTTLNAVSCPSTNSCFAVGSSTKGIFSAAPLTERWDGDRWSVMDTPTDGFFGYTELTGVSCVTTSSCFAVGYTAGPGAYAFVSPVTERWDGERWSIFTAPVPQFEFNGRLGGVSCSSTSECFAVGSSGVTLDGSGSTHTLVEQWDGTRWSADFSATRNPAKGINLAGVSCATRTSCFAVGNDLTNDRAVSRPLIERGPIAPPAGPRLNRPIVGMAATRSGRGHWLVASDGGIFTSGDAHFYGSTGAIKLNRPIVGMAATPSGHGYWLVASDGGIFTFGDAQFHGSTGAIKLNRPIVGMAATRSSGYWLVASDGGIFSFGDAHFYGSAAATNESIVGMAPTPSGHGYWLVASDGSVFSYGKTGFYGSTSATNEPIAGIAAGPGSHHYWLFGPEGNVFGF